ncbi:MAG: N-acetyl-alpha-D-glucosaminyl L-malate synthase BshA [Trueperaceae bacterium]
MKIILLLHSGVGGSGVVATELGLSLARLGHEIHFIAGSIPFRLGDAALDNVFFHQIVSMAYPLFDSPLTTLSEASRIVEVAEEVGIDVIHAHYAVPHATAALLARQMLRTSPAPAVVTTLHGTDVTLVGIDRAYLRATQWSIESSDVVTAVSNYLARTTVEDMGVRRDDIAVVHNAVDFERFSQAKCFAPRERFAGPDEKILMHISNFRAVKKTDDVVRVFARVNARVPARLLMVGEGPERPNAMALAHELGVSDRVVFLGSFPRVETLLCIADLFLLPSAKESFGLTALEAMASGVPVIASTIGGLPEVVEHGASGFLHEVGDIERMTASALSLLDNEDRHATFSSSARERARTQFDEATMVDAYLGHYRAALDRVRGR